MIGVYRIRAYEKYGYIYNRCEITNKKILLVHHKDRNRKNNNVDNLEWVTSSENNVHAHTMGLSKSPKYWRGITGENHPTYGIRGSQHPRAVSGRLKMPCGDTVIFKSIVELCREFNLHAGHISSVLSGARKQHKGWMLP